MKKEIAYLILAHTDPDQLARLARALDYKSRIFVHLDAKSDLAEFSSRDLPETVTFIENRVRVSWAAFSQVEATLRLMHAALRSGQDFSHLVMLSGLDYPIKPIAQLHAHLNMHPDHEFIRFADVSASDHYRVFFEHYWFLEANQWLPAKFDRHMRHGFGRALRQVLKKPQLDGIKVCWGSAYWALTKDCADYILKYTELHPEYLHWAHSSFAVDEHFFHTLVGNSEFLQASDGFLPYQGNKTYLMANLHLVHESMRKIYTEDDFEELLVSDMFFVRKVVSGLSSGLLDRLDHEVLHMDESIGSATMKGVL